LTEIRIPSLSASPHSLVRSGLQWLRRSGDRVAAREPIAVCHIRLFDAQDREGPPPLAEERHDLQVVLATRTAGTVQLRADLSKGGYRDLIGSAAWDAGASVGSMDVPDCDGALLPLLLAGRRGFESGEARGGLLPGWHDRVRACWQGERAAGTHRFGNLLALGNCEQTGLFRGDDMAFLSWFSRAPGPVQIMAIADERCVHSSAVLLQQLRRTPAEAFAITNSVHDWLSERLTHAGRGSLPAPASRRPAAQDMLYALHLLAEATGGSPILDCTETLTPNGVAQIGPPDALALSLGSEFAAHYRHQKTGWLVAFHAARFGPFIGAGIADWLRRDFERVPRTIADIETDLAALAAEVQARTGAVLLVQNVVASSEADRISNYSWLGDAFEDSVSVLNTEANMMLFGLTRMTNISMIDADALAAELGTKNIPDRTHASRDLLEAQRCAVHDVLRDRGIHGF
jgi:hypothetical protein